MTRETADDAKRHHIKKLQCEIEGQLQITARTAIITTCTNRKRHAPEASLRAGELEAGSTAEVLDNQAVLGGSIGQSDALGH